MYILIDQSIKYKSMKCFVGEGENRNLVIEVTVLFFVYCTNCNLTMGDTGMYVFLHFFQYFGYDYILGVQLTS